MTTTGPRWVVHIPIEAPDEESALLVARECALALNQLTPAADGLSAEVSREDHQSQRLPVFCNRLTPIGRCDLPAGRRHPDHLCGPEQEYVVK